MRSSLRVCPSLPREQRFALPFEKSLLVLLICKKRPFHRIFFPIGKFGKNVRYYRKYTKFYLIYLRVPFLRANFATKLRETNKVLTININFKRMKTKSIFLGMLMSSAFLLTTSCLSEPKDLEPMPVAETKKGKFTLDLQTGVDFVIATRAVDERSYQNTDNYTVEITDSRGNSAFSGTFATLKTRLPLELDLGSYNISAAYGTEYPASQNGFKVVGSNTFTILSSNTSTNPATTTVNCTPTAGKVIVEFNNAMATYYDTYSVEFSGTAALGTSKFIWSKAETNPYYVALNESAEAITYTIYLTAKTDYATEQGGEKITEATATGTFTLARNQAKKLTISPNYTPSTEGGLTIQITIDDSTNDKPIDIEVPVTWI